MRKFPNILRKYYLDITLAFPGLFLLITFFVAPAIAIFVVSFTRWPIIGSPTFVGLQNYFRLFTDEFFLRALKNTLYYTLILVPSITALSFVTALLLRNITRGREFFKVIYIFPMVVTLTSTAAIWKGLFLPFGPLNQILVKLGLNPIDFLSVELVIPSLCLVLIWRDIGYYALFFLAGFESIPPEVLEAATVDGAGPLHRFRYIIMPLMKPIIILVSILITIGSFMIFTLVYVITGGGPVYSSQALLNYIYDVGWKEFRMGYASASAVVYFIILFLLSMIQRLVIERE
jgi:ABC-type sugar transport system permease subunit